MGDVPCEIVYSGEFDSHSDAIKHDYYFKRLINLKFIEKLFHSKCFYAL